MEKNAKRLSIAIVGATGNVGRTFCKVLTEEKIIADYIPFNTKGGAVVEINGKAYMTQALTHESAQATKVDYALFSVGADLAREYAPIFAKNGVIVIDNSSAFRRDPDKALIIPECNANVIRGAKAGTIIANPNCTTIGSLVALKPLDDAFKLKRVIYSSYQAISGAGNSPQFAYPIENNVIPYIDGEEEKMVFETNKILGRTADNQIGVTATCVRVPVANCHTIVINATFEKPLTIEKVKKLLVKAPGLVLLPDDQLPMPVVANDRNEVFTGRVRLDASCPNTINLITASDNIRKGAATNAIQIMQYLMNAGTKHA
ncbi:MAG: aspartate-semialdehyde dehydrogenase [Christensenellaceae bacterium]|jgi:aspartate-semialdehyde dehydrogenase|nr:aspartate-semialdehyde dehydrogenase [Christensenellaceae bacterium]